MTTERNTDTDTAPPALTAEDRTRHHCRQMATYELFAQKRADALVNATDENRERRMAALLKACREQVDVCAEALRYCTWTAADLEEGRAYARKVAADVERQNREDAAAMGDA